MTISPDFKRFVTNKMNAPWWPRLAGRLLAWEINMLYWLSQRYDIRME